jgi:hypothetical protein
VYTSIYVIGEIWRINLALSCSSNFFGCLVYFTKKRNGKLIKGFGTLKFKTIFSSSLVSILKARVAEINCDCP